MNYIISPKIVFKLHDEINGNCISRLIRRIAGTYVDYDHCEKIIGSAIREVFVRVIKSKNLIEDMKEHAILNADLIRAISWVSRQSYLGIDSAKTSLILWAVVAEMMDHEGAINFGDFMVFPDDSSGNIFNIYIK